MYAQYLLYLTIRQFLKIIEFGFSKFPVNYVTLKPKNILSWPRIKLQILICVVFRVPSTSIVQPVSRKYPSSGLSGKLVVVNYVT